MSLDNRGTVLVEFAILVPVLVLLCFGFYEIHRYISISTYMKTAGYRLIRWATVDRTAGSVQNYVTCLLNEGSAYNMSTNGTFIITRMNSGTNSGNTSISTIYKYPATAPSSVTNSFPNLVNSGATNANSTIVIELRYQYVPVFYQFTSKTISQVYCCDYRGQ